MRIGNDSLTPQVAGAFGQWDGDAARMQSVGNTTAGASGSADKTKSSSSGNQDPVQLSPEAQRQVEKLKARDREVKTHEAAHMAAGAGLVRGGATYTYQQGPDGQRYAVGGEVSLDTSAVPNDPKATIAKAEQIRSAALAPAEPSSQDRAVAAQASQMEARARTEQVQKNGSAQKLGKSASPSAHARSGRLVDIVA